jgi:hypothetical protein
MKTFEYKIFPHMVQEEELNALGRQGWDLIIAQLGGKWILKREINLSPVQESQKDLAPSYGLER